MVLLATPASPSDYVELWHEAYKPNGVNEQPHKSRNIYFDARMEGLSYSDMVSGTASEFTIYSDIVVDPTYDETLEPWNVVYIDAVRVKINGESLTIIMEERGEIDSVFIYGRTIRWATNYFAHNTDVSI